MNVPEKISHLIKKEIDVLEIQIIDESYKHANHQKDTRGGHFKLRIVSDSFIDMTLLNRHKLIYQILDKMMKVEIHALSMKLLTNQEYDK
tara:strand:- start:1061 stop:1330 length:270 start_codon:yes stop_codon:yes gene_type:complete